MPNMLFDRPLPGLSRTPRELVLLSIGAFFVWRELRDGRPDWPNLAVYAGATLAFALRLFPARAIGVGTALGAIVQRWSHVRSLDAALALDWTGYLPFALLPLLASRDLVQRFDRAPSKIRWLRNLWGDLPERDARVLRICAYLLGMLAAALSQAGENAGLGWPWLVVGALGLAILALAAGRAAVLLLVPPAGIALALRVAIDLRGAEALLAGEAGPSIQGLFASGPEYALPSLLLAAAAAAIATPYALRLLQRA